MNTNAPDAELCALLGISILLAAQFKTKRCANCHQAKPLDDFYRCAKRGRQSRCIDCHRARKRGRSKSERRHDAEVAFAARFWSHVDKRAPDECWPWQGYSHKHGYGFISRPGYHAMQTGHRVAWELTNGPIPDGMHVLHTCDNPPCCNPAHLRVGTHTDNMRDMWMRGRARPGGKPACRRSC